MKKFYNLKVENDILFVMKLSMAGRQSSHTNSGDCSTEGKGEAQNISEFLQQRPGSPNIKR